MHDSREMWRKSGSRHMGGSARHVYHSAYTLHSLLNLAESISLWTDDEPNEAKLRNTSWSDILAVSSQVKGIGVVLRCAE